jgi:hypothetical protein
MILASKGVVELEYEPALLKTKKSFDFKVTFGKKSWIDVKSVGPAWLDDEARWERYEAISGNFPGNARLIVDRDLGHGHFGARVQGTVDHGGARQRSGRKDRSAHRRRKGSKQTALLLKRAAAAGCC